MTSTPTSGVHFSREQIAEILDMMHPPLKLLNYEDTGLGYNNRIYFISTVCGREVVLKVEGRYWKRQKTEAEVAGLLAIDRIYHGAVAVPRILGFSSCTKEGSVPWEWILLEKLQGSNMGDLWGKLEEGQKLDVARELGNIVVRIQSISPAALGLEDTRPQYGNLSLTQPKDNATAPGQAQVNPTHLASQSLYISHVLDGPPPSKTFLAYAYALLVHAIELLESPAQRARFVYQQNVARLPRLRHFAEQLRTDPLPVIRTMDASLRWRPVFTHGDLLPQNLLLHAQSVRVLDWEWCGFFPPHVEWEAGLNTLVAKLELSENGKAKEVFLEVLHQAGVITPWSAPPAEWEVAMKLTKLTERVVPWWLDDCANDIEEKYKEATMKRDKAVRELDELLEWFGV